MVHATILYATISSFRAYYFTLTIAAGFKFTGSHRVAYNKYLLFVEIVSTFPIFVILPFSLGGNAKFWRSAERLFVKV